MIFFVRQLCYPSAGQFTLIPLYENIAEYVYTMWLEHILYTEGSSISNVAQILEMMEFAHCGTIEEGRTGVIV